MKTYIGIKQIQAEPSGKISKTENGLEIDDSIQGYKVVYEDNYESWSPKRSI